MAELGLSGPQGLALGRLPLLGAVLRSRAATLGFAIVAAWAVVAALAPWLAPYDPTIIDFAAAADPTPSAQHLLGTDSVGREPAVAHHLGRPHDLCRGAALHRPRLPAWHLCRHAGRLLRGLARPSRTPPWPRHARLPRPGAYSEERQL